MVVWKKKKRKKRVIGNRKINWKRFKKKFKLPAKWTTKKETWQRERKGWRSFLISYVLKWTLCTNPIGSEIRTVGVKRPIQLSLWNRDRDIRYSEIRWSSKDVIFSFEINRSSPAWDGRPFFLFKIHRIRANLANNFRVRLFRSTLLSKNEFISRDKFFSIVPPLLSMENFAIARNFINSFEKSDFSPLFCF